MYEYPYNPYLITKGESSKRKWRYLLRLDLADLVNNSGLLYSPECDVLGTAEALFQSLYFYIERLGGVNVRWNRKLRTRFL